MEIHFWLTILKYIFWLLGLDNNKKAKITTNSVADKIKRMLILEFKHNHEYPHFDTIAKVMVCNSIMLKYACFVAKDFPLTNFYLLLPLRNNAIQMNEWAFTKTSMEINTSLCCYTKQRIEHLNTKSEVNPTKNLSWRATALITAIYAAASRVNTIRRETAHVKGSALQQQKIMFQDYRAAPALTARSNIHEKVLIKGSREQTLIIDTRWH